MQELQITSNSQTISHDHNTISRTLTHLYGKMKNNRPLPSIPSSFRNIHPFKSRQQNRSGAYDSIKSNNSNAKQVLAKQHSQSSDCSYLEPVTVKTISETVTNTNKQNELNQVKDVTPFTTTKVGLELQNNSDDPAADLYIHPQFVAEIDNRQNNSTDGDSNPSKQTYVNLREVETSGKGTLELDNAEVQNDGTEVGTNHSDYMRMDSCTNKVSTDQQKVDHENINNTNSNKNRLVETDSSGYTPMSSVNKINNKPMLEKSDSTFPQLIGFTPSYEADMKDYLNEENKTVKTKRYVQDA